MVTQVHTLGIPLVNSLSLVPPMTVEPPRMGTRQAKALNVAATTVSSVSLIPNSNYAIPKNYVRLTNESVVFHTRFYLWKNILHELICTHQSDIVREVV